MKKLLSLILSLIITSTTLSVFAEDEIYVYLNGRELSFAQNPIIRNDFTLVPFRAIFEELGMTVQWSGENRCVRAERENLKIVLYIDNTTMYVNDSAVTLTTPPIIYNDYTLVPLRAVSEAAGAEVEWDSDTRSVDITSSITKSKYWEREVVELVNNERKNYGLNPLKWDDSLAKLATSHCEDMINRNFFDHINPDGETPFDRMKKAGISYWVAGENIAAGQYSPEEVMKSWMDSTGHRANILDSDFEYIGVSVVYGGKYGIYWAQNFAKFK